MTGEDARSPSLLEGARLGDARPGGRGHDAVEEVSSPSHPDAFGVDPPPEGEGEAGVLARLWPRLTPDERGRLKWAADAHDAQRAPLGDWRTWVFLGGRGAGKTRAGAEWVWGEAARLRRLVGRKGRIALVAPTLHDARTVMVEGPSGVLALPWRSGARFEPSMRRVVFPGGVLGLLFSAEEPERLRGPQFHAAWGDELCAWGRAEETLAMLRLGLRLGDRPRLVLTSTPKPRRWLRRMLEEVGCVVTRAGTAENAKNLAPGFEAEMRALYGGTRRAAQELDGVVLDDGGALFTAEMMRAAKAAWGSPSPCGGGSTPEASGWGGPGEGRAEGSSSPSHPVGCADDPPSWREGDVVVAVDPPAGTLDGRARDGCGIVAAGREGARFVVLADRTVSGRSPEGWARAVRRAVEDFGAARVVAETNQGGAMVEAVLKGAGLSVPVTRVHAVLGKAERAEPAAALYEQGRVAHAPGLEALEEELMGLGVETEGPAAGSPDRADALVWALIALTTKRREGPWIRQL